jgi:endoribonuclease Dicer
LQGFIRNEPFDPKTWIIPGAKSREYKLEEFVYKGTKIYTRPNRKLKRKVVADVVEALIGAYLSAGGETAALLFMDWIGIKVNFNITPYEREFNACPENMVNVVFLESLLKYSFRDRSLLVEALTHGSYMLPDVPRCYQVLTVIIIIHVETGISIYVSIYGRIFCLHID